jgi:hypothetical protein
MSYVVPLLLAAGYNALQTVAVSVFAAGGGALYWAGKEIFYRDNLPTPQQPVPEPFSLVKVVSSVALGLVLVVVGVVLLAVSQGQVQQGG